MRPVYLGILTMFAATCYGQAAKEASFEVASIKPAAPMDGPLKAGMRMGCGGGPGTTTPGLWTCTSTSLAELIIRAYQLPRYQFTPESWMFMTRLDVNAKVPAGTTKEQLLEMQRSLLRDRFKLASHNEKKDGPVYELTVGKGGTKLKESAADAAFEPEEPGTVPRLTLGKDGFPEFGPGHGGMIGLNGKFRWKAINLTMAEIVKTLSEQVGRPVVDLTGLKGKYDIDMTWQQESMMARAGDANVAADPEAGLPINRAIQDELGLKLESKKGTVDVFVVDHVEKVAVEN